MVQNYYEMYSHDRAKSCIVLAESCIYHAKTCIILAKSCKSASSWENTQITPLNSDFYFDKFRMLAQRLSRRFEPPKKPAMCMLSMALEKSQTRIRHLPESGLRLPFRIKRILLIPHVWVENLCLSHLGSGIRSHTLKPIICTYQSRFL